MLLVVLEILVVIVAPLLAWYRRGPWPPRTVAGGMALLAVLWYLTYAPIHELSHALATVLVGGRVMAIKLIPSFWEGTFAGAWVDSALLDRPWQQVAMLAAPYLLDVAALLVGLAVLRRRPPRGALRGGLLLVLLCLRPAFDLVTESVAYVRGAEADLWHIAWFTGGAGLWAVLLPALAVAVVGVVAVARSSPGAPRPQTHLLPAVA